MKHRLLKTSEHRIGLGIGLTIVGIGLAVGALNKCDRQKAAAEFGATPSAVETIQGKERASIPFNCGKGVVTRISITVKPIAKKPATSTPASSKPARGTETDDCLDGGYHTSGHKTGVSGQ